MKREPDPSHEGRRTQCKDIPDMPILLFLQKLNGRWANWYFGNEYDVGQVMPQDTPEKLKLAKMRMLMHRGLVDGCDCGCRGDFVLTDKGAEYIAAAGLTGGQNGQQAA